MADNDYINEDEPAPPPKAAVKVKRGKNEPNPRRGKVSKAAGDAPATFEAGGAAAPKVFDAGAVCEELKIYWLPERGDCFVMQSPDGRWSQWTKDACVDAMRALPGRMIAIKARENEMLSESKQVLMHARQLRACDGLLPSLPGYKSGVWTLDGGERVIVRQSPTLVVPTPGPWENVRQLIHGMLDRSKSGGVDQTPWWHSWCLTSARAIREGEPGHWRAGHALVLAGPAGCGKNRLQEQIITPLLGGYGRFADPAKFLFESDEFNGDVFAAEHLMLSEIPMPSQRTVDRTSLAEKIKQVVANPSQRMRLMRTEPCSVSPFWRLTISVNDDPDKLRSLPLITSDFGDKVLILHCQMAPLPIIQTNDIESQKEFRRVMAEELPHYLHWLLNEWTIPDDLKVYPDGRDATRFGFREFHAACIKEDLFEETPAAELLHLIDLAELRGKDDASWVPGEAESRSLKVWEVEGDRPAVDARGAPLRMWWGRAQTLQMLLTGEGVYMSSVATLAKKLFQHNKCSTLLARLEADEGLRGVRLEKKATRDWKGWLIAPPAN